MLISTKQKHNSVKSRSEALELKIRDNELEVVQKTKYLGVQIDCSLGWKEQIMTASSLKGFKKSVKGYLFLSILYIILL